MVVVVSRSTTVDSEAGEAADSGAMIAGVEVAGAGAGAEVVMRVGAEVVLGSTGVDVDEVVVTTGNRGAAATGRKTEIQRARVVVSGNRGAAIMTTGVAVAADSGAEVAIAVVLGEEIAVVSGEEIAAVVLEVAGVDLTRISPLMGIRRGKTKKSRLTIDL